MRGVRLSLLPALGASAVAVLLIVVAVSLLPGSTPPIEGAEAVATLDRVRIGGDDQWILVRGEDRSNPLLLYLHGGPGAPSMPSAHVFGPQLERHFVVVHWDQRGAGKSFHWFRGEAPSADRMLDDVVELVELLRERFDRDRIFLLGHSWGSVLGVRTVVRRPELFHAYIGVGQIVDKRRQEEISYDWVVEQARADGNTEALEELASVEPPYGDDIFAISTQRAWLSKYRGVYYDGGGGFGQLLRGLLGAPEYSYHDVASWLAGSYFSMRALWPEEKSVDLIQSAPRLEVPVWFLSGRRDYNTPFELVEEYYARLDAPAGKHLVWFERSAHSPQLEEPDRFAEVMAEIARSVMGTESPGRLR